MRNVYNRMIFQLMYGLFQVPAVSRLSGVWIVLQQAQKRSGICPAHEGIKQNTEDEGLQVPTVLSCNQRVAGILRCVEDD